MMGEKRNIHKWFWVQEFNIVVGIANSFNPMPIGFVNLLCAALLMYALGRIHGKKEALQKDRQLYE